MSVNSSSGSNDLGISTLREANVQLELRIRTKVQEMVEFNKKTTTSKDMIIASLNCAGDCIVSLDRALAANRVRIQHTVHQPMLVSSSKDLTKDRLRSNAKLLLEYFKEHTLQYFFKAFFPPVTAPDDDVVRKSDILRFHLEKCESLIDKVMMELGYGSVDDALSSTN